MEEPLEVVYETKLLGITCTSDAKFSTNTNKIIKKGASKLWMIRRLKSLGGTKLQLLDMYTLHVRSQLEICVPLWHSSLTKVETRRLENIQKMALAIILGLNYRSYSSALVSVELEKLEDRRKQLCLNFAEKCVKNSKHAHMFPKTLVPSKTRKFKKSKKFLEQKCRTSRSYNSAIPYLSRLLNEANL